MPDDAETPTFSGWSVLEKLGQGGMCSVWRVSPVDGQGPERAIKVLEEEDDAAAQRFAGEARLLQRIEHPNVLRIHELHDEARPPWIVMDLLAGRDLEETREQQGPMDPERAARIIADVASGLARVHELGVRHRDIKPANIMVGHDGVPRLIDFGIARETSKAHVTRQGFVVGTASYLPPEIYEGDDARAIQDTESADVYALGQTLCELLAGVPAHPRGSGAQATSIGLIMKEKLARPHLDPRAWRPQVPEDLARVVIAATRRDPAQRTPTARKLEEGLRAWIRARNLASAAPLTAVDPSSLPPPPTRTHRVPPAPSAAASQRAAPGLGRTAIGVVGLFGALGVLAAVALGVLVLILLATALGMLAVG